MIETYYPGLWREFLRTQQLETRMIGLKYSEDQPRDEQGRFGSTGGDGSNAGDSLSAASAADQLQSAGIQTQKLDQMSDQQRGEMVGQFTALRDTYPDVRVGAVVVANAKEVPSVRGKLAATINGGAIVFSESALGSVESDMRASRASGYGADYGSLTPMQALTAHEFGHVVDAQMFGGLGADASLPAASGYARSNYSERFAEGFMQYVAGVESPASNWIADRIASKVAR